MREKPIREATEETTRVRWVSERTRPLFLGDHLAWWIATGAASGLVPRAPGTVGALLGWGLFLISTAVEHTLGIPAVPEIVAVLLLGVGLWASSRALPFFSRMDPPQIVIDEIAGQFLALLIVFSGRDPFSGEGMGLGLMSFGLFRLFDIGKPYPLRRVERWRGGWGIMADDLLAGAYAGLTLDLALLFGRLLS